MFCNSIECHFFLPAISVLASGAIHVVNLTSQHSQLFVRTAVMFTFRQGHGQWLPPADERACPHEAQRHEYKKSTLLTCVPTSVLCIGYLKMWIYPRGLGWIKPTWTLDKLSPCP